MVSQSSKVSHANVIKSKTHRSAKAQAVHHEKLKSREKLYQESNQVFLTTIAAGQTLRQAARKAGLSLGCFFRRRKVDKNFAADWVEALGVGGQFEEDVRRKFLVLITEGLGVNQAARLVGRCLVQLSQVRRQDPSFALAWEKAVTVGQAKKLSQLKTTDLSPFLAALQDGQTLTKAAELVNLTPSSLYFLKKHDPSFAQKWEEAKAGKNELA
ncbi:MAG: hypothetical protein LBI10_07490 [Deltaproteobacteria bacterium]|nr:hypothetical protein [Deltaproteobacteria bacterium]